MPNYSSCVLFKLVLVVTSWLALSSQAAWASAANHDVSGLGSTRSNTNEAVHSCPWKDLKFSASMKATEFEPGQPVSLRSTVTNRDAVTCSITVGHDRGYDPTQVIINHVRKFVWDACDLDNKAGSCSNLWMLTDLAPGTSYKLVTTWNQLWGQGSGRPPVQVPAGTYKFGSGYTDLVNSVIHSVSASVAFVIG